MKKSILKFTSILLLCIGIVFGGPLLTTTPNAYAAPEESEVESPSPDEEEDEKAEEEIEEQSGENVCVGQAGSISWILCPVLNTVSSFVDTIYGLIDKLLAIRPTTMDQESPVYQIWQKARDITNIVFIIFMLIVIYSQITGLGIDNYGIKRILPRLIIAVIIVNLSYLITALLVDISNIVGSGVMDAFVKIQNSINVPNDPFNDISWGQLFGHLTAGAATIWGISVAASGAGNLLWMIALALIGALISVAIGLITISLRQGVVLILIMISPIAFVAYLLPNTEKWFTKWKNVLGQMLVFYPMFSFLYGASRLAGWAIIHSAGDSLLVVLLGMAVQVFPLFITASLLKMSNTILGSISAGLEKLSNPARNAIGQWGNSHREHSRQKYLERKGAAGYLTGAHLRKYLMERNARRDFETEQLALGNRALIAARVANRANSYKGLDKDGMDSYSKRPNFTTRAAKRAANNQLIAREAEDRLKNTLGEYNKIFKDQDSQDLNAVGGRAFVGLYGQSLRAENIATSDQNQLLNTFIKAYKSGSGYDFNRLIRSPSISLGHGGESTLIGRVLMRSVEIEGRRMTEARVVGNKFNFPKNEFRAMAIDVAKADDNGHEIDPITGEVVDDDQFRVKPGMQHRQWDKYIGVHKKTGNEITKEEYDALDANQRKEYERVRYVDIPDDDGIGVQRIYSDDAAYMKEYLTSNIAIADPINRRYNTLYGLNRETGEAGPLRKFHSRISSAMGEAQYKNKDGAINNMLLSQANLGNIQNMTHLNIARLQSISAAADAGSMNRNDAYVFEDQLRIFQSAENPELFEHFFREDELASYLDVNNQPLKGYRIGMREDGHLEWKEVAADDPTLTNEERKDYIKHKLMPKAMRKMFGMGDKITQSIAEKQKPDALKALRDLLDEIARQALKNSTDDGTAFTDKLDPNMNIAETPDVNELKRRVKQTRATINHYIAQKEQSSIQNDTTITDYSTIFKVNKNIEEKQEYQRLQEEAKQIDNIISELNSNFDVIDDYRTLADSIRTKFQENDTLKEYLDVAEQIIMENQYGDVYDIFNSNTDEAEARAENLQTDILELLYQIAGTKS